MERKGKKVPNLRRGKKKEILKKGMEVLNPGSKSLKEAQDWGPKFKLGIRTPKRIRRRF